MTLPRFHLAFPVNDLEKARAFYINILGCKQGRDSDRWIDFDFHGHQIVAHLDENMTPAPTSDVDGKQVPGQHFGLLMARDDWHILADRLKAENIPFLIEPYIRFEGEVGEQATLFIQDPSGNGLEFKSFASDEDIFAPSFK